MNDIISITTGIALYIIVTPQPKAGWLYCQFSSIQKPDVPFDFRGCGTELPDLLSPPAVQPATGQASQVIL